MYNYVYTYMYTYNVIYCTHIHIYTYATIYIYIYVYTYILQICSYLYHVYYICILSTSWRETHQGYLSPYLCLDAANPTRRVWESLGDSGSPGGDHGSHGKTIGKPWENHGKISDIPNLVMSNSY